MRDSAPLSERFESAMRAARYGQFSDDPAEARKAARMFSRLRKTPFWARHMAALHEGREERASARALRLWA